jgi:hypothetical protein
MDGGRVVGSMICSICLLPPSQRRQIDRALFLERREPFREVARRFKMSRRTIQKHYRHHVEAILAQEPSTSTVANTPTVVYAPTINMVVSEAFEEKEEALNTAIAEEGGGGS